jgi:hypothetical protein
MNGSINLAISERSSCNFEWKLALQIFIPIDFLFY